MANQNNNGIAGQLGIGDHTSDINHAAFMFHQMLGRASTMKLVKVVKVNVKKDGDVAEAGTVDVVPLVNQVDGLGESTKHGTVYGLQYTRWQAGGFAIINDPIVGDIGYAVVSDRDTSAVIKKKDQANPGSHRRYDLSDGVYIGGILNKAPSQYLQVVHGTNKDGSGGQLALNDANGNIITMAQDGDKKAVITVTDGNKNTITLSKDGVTVHTETDITLDTKNGTGNVKVKGHVRATGNVYAGDGGSDQISLQGHIHGTSPAPNPGT